MSGTSFLSGSMEHHVHQEEEGVIAKHVCQEEEGVMAQQVHQAEESMTLSETLADAEKRLRTAGVPDAGTDVWLLLSFVLQLDRAKYYLSRNDPFPEEKKSSWEKLIEKRCQRIPLQHLTGEQEFMGYSFYVNEHVLVPRQETELLVEEAVERYDRKEVSGKILDLCTGSGCIIISVLKQLAQRGRTGLSGTGVELSKDAYEVAEKNASLLHEEIQDGNVGLQLLLGDLFSPVTGRYGMILSNPPYIKTSEIPKLMEEVREHEPHMALDGKEDGLYFYRKIISEASEYLEEKGILILEIGYDQGDDVSRLLKEAGFVDVEIKKDYGGNDRIAVGTYER